jgi:hypothetical protein
MQIWTDGLVAVLDAVGSKQASVFAMSGLSGMLGVPGSWPVLAVDDPH